MRFSFFENTGTCLSTGVADGFQAPLNILLRQSPGLLVNVLPRGRAKSSSERPRCRILELQGHSKRAEEERGPDEKGPLNSPRALSAVFPRSSRSSGLCPTCTFMSWGIFQTCSDIDAPLKLKPNPKDRGLVTLTHECTSPKNLAVDSFTL